MPLTVASNASNSGTTTLTNSTGSTNRTLTLPDATTTLVGTDTAQTLTNKTLTTPILTSAALGTLVTGEIEYDGTAQYFTPLSSQRGVVPAMQYYRLNSGLAGSNATGAQNLFGVGVTLASSTTYEFRSHFLLSKTAGTTSHTVSLLYGGTATLNNILWNIFTIDTALGTLETSNTANGNTVATTTALSASSTAATQQYHAVLTGTVSINAGGTFIPQYSLSAAPGGAYTTQAGSFFEIWPVGVAGANISVGTWA